MCRGPIRWDHASAGKEICGADVYKSLVRQAESPCRRGGMRLVAPTGGLAKLAESAVKVETKGRVGPHQPETRLYGEDLRPLAVSGTGAVVVSGHEVSVLQGGATTIKPEAATIMGERIIGGEGELWLTGPFESLEGVVNALRSCAAIPSVGETIRILEEVGVGTIARSTNASGEEGAGC